MDRSFDAYSNGGMRNAAASAFGIASSSDVTEELPPMRAVSLMSQPASLQYSTAPASFGKAPPIGLKPLSSKRSTSVTVRKESNEANWNVVDLEQVPLGFPLERTHREIHGADATEVANRITKALKKLSVEAEYDGDKAKAKCTSLDMVSFRIRLFAGGENGLPVVVEVQRRSGSPSSFMKICRQILDGADGSTVETAPAPCTKMPPFVKGPIGNMKCLQNVVVKEEEKTEVTAINKSMDLLKSKQKDSNLLGLENLCMLTDPLKTRPDKALNACKAIIVEEQCSELREEIGVILQKDAFLPEEFDDKELLAKKSRHLALLLLSNSLELTSKDGCLASAMETQKWFGKVLIPTLLDEVKGFEANPNNAYEAACSLTSLANSCDVAKKFMEENSAVEDLQSAHSFGLMNHELLASEAEQALIAMGKSV